MGGIFVSLAFRRWVGLLFALSSPALAVRSYESHASPAIAVPASTPPTEQGGARKKNVPPRKDRTQFVLFNFDVTPIWGKTLERNNIHKLLVKARDARPSDYEGPEPTMTVFINTGFLQLSPHWRPGKRTPAEFRAPEAYQEFRARLDRGPKKIITYLSSPQKVLQSAERLQRLNELGVEIASHGVMHLNGEDWSVKDWRTEFDEHDRVLKLLHLPEAKGYRAPFLATGRQGAASLADPLFKVLHEREMRFDSSKILVSGPRWPRKIVDTNIWEIAVDSIVVNGIRTVMFGAYETTDSDLHYNISMAEFQKRYRGNRAPLLLGGHGEHMGSHARLMRTLCYLPNVRCGTFSELIEYMDQHPELSGHRG